MGKLKEDLKGRDAIDFKHESVGRLFRRMFFPSLVSMVSMVVLNITDGAFVGHGVGSDALAAVNIVAPLFMLMTGLGLMFGIGSSVVASIHLSQDNVKAANINLTQGLLGGILTNILLGAIVFLFQEETCRLFGCSDALLPLACSYLRWLALLMPFNSVGLVGMFLVRLDGSPRYAMCVNLSLALLNIVLDYVCIYILGWGLEGAAIATCFSFSVGIVPVLAYLLHFSKTIRLYRLRLTFKSLCLSLRNIWYQMRLGFSGLLGEIAMAFMLVMGNYAFIGHLGEDGVAAFSAACYCLPIVFMLGNAIVQSVQPIVSYAYGAGDSARQLQGRRLSLTVAVVCGILGMLFMSLGAPLIAVAFLQPDCHAYELCKAGLPYFSLSFLFIALNIVVVGYLQSIERAMAATLYTTVRGFVLVIPSFLLLPIWLGEKGLWMALPVAEGATVLLALVLYVKSRVYK